MEFKLNVVPPSYNHHFRIDHRNRQVYLSKEAQEFKKLVFLYTPPYKLVTGRIYSLIIKIHANWWCKNGNIRRKDIQNLDKLLIDAMFEKFGVDDSVVFKTTIEKLPLSGKYVDKQEEYTVVKLEEIKR